MPFRLAHEIVGRLVARAQESGIPLNKLAPEAFLSASPVLTPAVVERTFELRSALAARRTIGAPSPENVARELDRWSVQLG